jgi:hypothetical protein
MKFNEYLTEGYNRRTVDKAINMFFDMLDKKETSNQDIQDHIEWIVAELKLQAKHR